ncbi:MAG TPA: tRNA (adenosine(37)-N6)-threonylcarbamoyltransferase complex dimerization subunit type 1 TsaB [Candidatus Limnocylindria bacterium]|nr:tRNA (adenosine(37)-N6)-threonylcarbamoyltransferase complex dimerization subunit type 1 TsaB [Candidatus Limnocylindria bacterium]
MILAIEAASTDPSVAVAGPDGALLAVDGWSATPRQAQELLPRLMDLLARAGGSLAQVTGIGVGLGPGSFTGLRVGMSVAKGLAFGLDIPIVGIPSLEAWLHAEPRADGALARAGARDAYLLLRGSDAPRIVDRDDVPRKSHLVAPAELAEAFELGEVLSPVRAAGAVAEAAAERLRADPGGDDLEHLEPRYLRLPRGVSAAVAQER